MYQLFHLFLLLLSPPLPLLPHFILLLLFVLSLFLFLILYHEPSHVDHKH